MTHDILVNAVELASALAEEEMVLHYSDDMAIYEYGVDNGFVYTEEAQNLFGILYDKYYSAIEKSKI